MIGLGTIVNVAAIIIGSIIGYYINDRFFKNTARISYDSHRGGTFSHRD